MFYVKDTRREDVHVYYVYNVRPRRDTIYILLDRNGSLSWVNAKHYRPVCFNQNTWLHSFVDNETKTEHNFYAVESIADTHYLIYFCEWCNSWHKKDIRDCKIKN